MGPVPGFVARKTRGPAETSPRAEKPNPRRPGRGFDARTDRSTLPPGRRRAHAFDGPLSRPEKNEQRKRRREIAGGGGGADLRRGDPWRDGGRREGSLSLSLLLRLAHVDSPPLSPPSGSALFSLSLSLYTRMYSSEHAKLTHGRTDIKALCRFRDSAPPVSAYSPRAPSSSTSGSNQV